MEVPEYVYPATATARLPAECRPRDYARGNFQGQHAAVRQFRRCGSTPCSGGTISAPTKVERIAAQSAAGCELPLSRREREFVFSVEDDENHTEGVERGHKRPTRPATIRLI